jgi:hypothetical protein
MARERVGCLEPGDVALVPDMECGWYPFRLVERCSVDAEARGRIVFAEE